MKLYLQNVVRVGLLSSAIALTACSGSSGGGTSSGLVISGQLGGTSLMSLNKRSQKSSNVGVYDGSNAYAVEFSDLEIVATASTEPPTTVTASVNTDGTFSVDLGKDASGTPVTITFVNENTDAVVGEVKFTDSTKTDLNGNPKADSAVVPSGSLALGAITLSEDGTVDIPKTQVASSIQSDAGISSGTAFNPTGEWAMDAYDKTPAGFQTVGAVDPDDPGSPHIGFKVTLARFTGKEFTPGTGNCEKDASGTIASCPVASGTVGADDRFALSIWGGDYSESIGACGGTTGFSADEARGYGRIHIASGTLPTIGVSGTINFGPYSFTTPSGYGGTGSAPYNLPWMKTTSATAMYDESDCRPYSVSGTTKMYNAWACRSKVYTGSWPGTAVSTGTMVGWNIGIQGGGCFDMNTNKPINVTNWNTIGMPSTWEAPVSATAVGAGFYTHANTYTNVDPDGSGPLGNTSIKCYHTGGQFEDSSGDPTSTALSLPGGQYLGKPETVLAQGAACSTAGSATPAAILAGYRCYANVYWQNGGGQGGGCRREFNFNWQATNPADFVSRSDFKGRPKNAFVTNILNYAADGKSAVLEDEESESVTIPTSANGSTFCRVVRKTQLTFKSISATKMLVELKENGRMASTDAACIAAANAAVVNDSNDLHWMLQSQKMIFYLNKVN